MNLKKYFIFIPLTLLLISCDNNVPLEIANIVNSFSIEKALLNDTTCSLNYLETHYEYDNDFKEIEVYSNEVEVSFDSSSEENYYYYIKETTNNIKENNVISSEILARYIEVDKYELSTKDSDGLNIETISKLSMQENLTEFYYREASNEMYSGGLYFGDEFKININQYIYMDIIDGYLTYTLEYTQFDKLPFLQKLSYDVDGVGMVKNFYQEIIEFEHNDITTAKPIRKNIFTLTSIYNQKLNKLENL